MSPTKSSNNPNKKGEKLNLSEMGQRIRYVRECHGHSREAFSGFIGEESHAINDVERGRKRVTSDLLRKVKEEYRANADWLLTGVPPVFQPGCAPAGHEDEAGVPHMYEGAGETPGNIVMIPKYDIQISAGHGAILHVEKQDGSLAFKREWLDKRGLQGDQLGIFPITGDSMYPRLAANDLAMFNMADKNVKSGQAYALRIGEELVVKYLQYLPGGVLQASSENKAYEPFTIDTSVENGVEIIGRLVTSMHEWI